ncbi:MAG: TetR/AcrR family transcriptional regulator [Gemmatimonadetes bacterium]|nr:TetR/AcrR family transcriptional regulator [Gemmatimonadota bacterium]
MSLDERPRHDEKLASILKAAAAIFADKGYHQASIRDIAGATGISLSGLYYYFKSKEELLFLIQDHCFGTILERLENDLEGVADPEERLRILVRNHLHFFVNSMREMKVLSHEARALTAEYRRRVNAKKKRYTEIVMEILSELKPAGSAVDLRVATFGLFGMMNWIYNWYRPERDVPVEELAENMIHVFLRGYVSAMQPARTPAAARGAARTQGSIWREG